MSLSNPNLPKSLSSTGTSLNLRHVERSFDSHNLNETRIQSLSTQLHTSKSTNLEQSTEIDMKASRYSNKDYEINQRRKELYYFINHLKISIRHRRLSPSAGWRDYVTLLPPEVTPSGIRSNVEDDDALHILGNRSLFTIQV